MNKRISPKGVTVLLIGVLSCAGLHLLRLVYAIQNWQWLIKILGWVVIYMAVSGLSFFFLDLVMMLLIVKRNKRTYFYLSGYILILLLAYWIDRLFLSIGESFKNVPFVIGFQLLLIIIYLILMKSRGMQTYFGDEHAH
ncbi:MAG: hypothetical protein ACPL3P_07130 [Anaerolineales bacterium]